MFANVRVAENDCEQSLANADAHGAGWLAAIHTRTVIAPEGRIGCGRRCDGHCGYTGIAGTGSQHRSARDRAATEVSLRGRTGPAPTANRHHRRCRVNAASKIHGDRCHIFIWRHTAHIRGARGLRALVLVTSANRN